jgi:two-component system response regulator FixJ
LAQDLPIPRGARRIVLVDDDPAVLEALAFAFEVDGYRVDTFPGARRALAADLADAACLIIDLRLPDLDGLKLVEQLRARGDAAPAVLITSQPKFPDLARAAALEVVVVEKPLLTDELAEAVRWAIAGAAPPASPAGPVSSGR